MNICWRTRKKGDSPRGKAKVYFSCCDSDFEKFSDKIFYDSLGEICSLEDFPIITLLDEESFEISKVLFELLLKSGLNIA